MKDEEIGDDEFTIVRLRGLPWEATEDNVIEFFFRNKHSREWSFH